jgi:hypothetical protein
MIREQFWRGNAKSSVNQDENGAGDRLTEGPHTRSQTIPGGGLSPGGADAVWRSERSGSSI